MKHVTYDSLKQSARHYKGETNYCTVIATALIFGLKFGKARSLLARECNRKTGKGLYRTDYLRVWKEKGVQLKQYPLNNGTLMKVADRLPSKGTFIVHSRGHVSVVRDGKLEDWAENSRKRVVDVYKVEYN